jgi:hypothetical protein
MIVVTYAVAEDIGTDQVVLCTWLVRKVIDIPSFHHLRPANGSRVLVFEGIGARDLQDVKVFNIAFFQWKVVFKGNGLPEPVNGQKA